MSRATPLVLNRIYGKLFSYFGPQHWWLGETPFEVAVGAILTQNTSWDNAFRAVLQLKRGGFLHPAKLDRMPAGRLARLIRSSGYFNQKAKRLKLFVGYLMRRHAGSMARMKKVPTGQLRRELLEIWGIGPETADSILLYALNRPVFVVDAYTRRLLVRHGLAQRDASYEQLQGFFHKAAVRERNRAARHNEYHALIVETGKRFCRIQPDCNSCPLRAVGKIKLEDSSSKRS